MSNKFDQPKDPDGVADYGLNWAPWLLTDTISTSIWIVVTPGIVVNSSSHDTTTTTVWLSGGTSGQTYSLTNRVVTVAGRTKDWTVQLKIKDL